MGERYLMLEEALERVLHGDAITSLLAMVGINLNGSAYTRSKLMEVLDRIDIETTNGSHQWDEDMRLKYLSYKHSAMAAALAVGVALGTPWPAPPETRASSVRGSARNSVSATTHPSTPRRPRCSRGPSTL